MSTNCAICYYCAYCVCSVYNVQYVYNVYSVSYMWKLCILYNPWNEVFKIRIILIFRKILFSGFVRKCHFFTSCFLRFSENPFQRSYDWKCILSYNENYPLFTKWKRLHFTHQGRGWFSHNFSHDFPVITLFWYHYIIPENRIFMPKIK